MGIPFIFSDRLKHKLSRHVLFWVVWIIVQVAIYTLPYIFSVEDMGWLLVERFFFSLALLVPHIFIVYSLMYYVMPRFVARGKYSLAFVISFSLLLAAIAMYILLNLTIINTIMRLVNRPGRHVGSGLKDVTPLALAVLAFWGLYGSITVSGFALTIKFLKLWYIKEQKNIQLQKENLVSKTQLLQSQVHPHFLFNTLNNIYSSALPNAPIASKMIMRLSTLLRYILYECNKPAVPLNRELDMIRKYADLETMRYDEKLEISIQTPEDAGQYEIAPLILLPFVENCFKHGSSNMIERPWINLNVQLVKNLLSAKIVNGKAANSVYNEGGIGINNARKRLELLYPGKFELKVVNEEEVFAIDLRIELSPLTLTNADDDTSF